MRTAKVLLILLLISSHLAQAETAQLSACIDDHPPYQVLGDPPSGQHIEALKILAKILGKEINFIQSPNFARCVAFLEKGEVDVIAGLNPTKERAQFAFFAPFKKADSLKVISKKQISIKTYADLKGKIIGVARGETYFPRFDKDKSLDKISIQNARIGFSLLQKDRIDILMVSPEKFTSLSKQQDLSELWISPIELDENRNKETFFGFSKKHSLGLDKEALLGIIHDAYQNGQFNQIKF